MDKNWIGSPRKLRPLISLSLFAAHQFPTQGIFAPFHVPTSLSTLIHSTCFLMMTVPTKTQTHSYRPISSSQFNHLWPFRLWETADRQVLLEAAVRSHPELASLEVHVLPTLKFCFTVFLCLKVSVQCCVFRKLCLATLSKQLSDLSLPYLCPLALASLIFLPRIYRYLNFRILSATQEGKLCAGKSFVPFTTASSLNKVPGMWLELNCLPIHQRIKVFCEKIK